LAKLNSISIGELGDGTAIGTGLSCAVFHLEKSSSVRKSIVLITDGENNAGSINPVTAARFAREKGISVYVLGVGTKGVVHLEYTDPKTQKVYSGYLESNFDNAALSRISLEANGKYFEADTISALSQAVSSINKTESAVVSYHMKNNDIEYYRIFLYFAAAFVTLAWIFRRFVLQEVL
jgi:Ca-activated chloride channel family protein